MINNFLTYLKGEIVASPHTVDAYRRDIAHFISFYGVDPVDFNPNEIKHIDIRSWMMSQVECGTASSTVNRRLSTIRSFYKYLLKHELVDSDPTKRLHSLKKGRRIPAFVEKSKIVNYGERIFVSGDNYEDSRRSLIVLLFYATGMRISELIDIEIDKVSIEDREIIVNGKGDKQRVLPLADVVVEKVKKYLKFRNEICDIENNFLFLSKKKRKISRSEVYKIVVETLSVIGVEGKRSPHVLRHTFATHLLNEGVGIESVKELLGHVNLSTTQIYTHTTIEELKRAYAEAHPHGKSK